MFATYQNPIYDYCKSPDQEASSPVHHPLIIVGAGPIGLAAALEANLQGIPAVVLDDNNTVSIGSRAVCYSKRALEILDRLGCARRILDKGITWQVGKVFFQDKLVTRFDLLPEEGHEHPAFVNLQQYYLEEFMVDQLAEKDNVEIRWKNKVVGVENHDGDPDQPVLITVETPDGSYQMTSDWLIVADGANSPIRTMLDLPIHGKVFGDTFLSADIVMKHEHPLERWFAFDPQDNPGRSTLLHRQADDVWRISFQLGRGADHEEEGKPENVRARVRAMMGEDIEFELEWTSVYTYRSRRMDHFRQGRVVFAGDAAHQVSPYGARGANSGFQDTDNLIWKLKLVMDGKAPDALIDSYCEEREFAADENLLHSTRSTDFISPESHVSKLFRNSVLELSQDYHFAKGLINSGRLSDAAVLTDSSLNTPDDGSFLCSMVPGAAMDDAPVKVGQHDGWLLNELGNHFQLLYFFENANEINEQTIEQLLSLQQGAIPVEPIVVVNTGKVAKGIKTLVDVRGMMTSRYDAQDGSCYLVRPDQHVAARWQQLNVNKVRQAVNIATCNQTR